MRNKHRKNGNDRGSVMTAVITPSKILLVIAKYHPNALWKLPGGGIEERDEDVVATAIREVREETGIELSRTEIVVCSEQRRDRQGRYFPYFCVAEISDARMGCRKKFGDEDGKIIQTGLFDLGEVSTMVDLLDRHRGFIAALEELRVAVQR